MRSRLFCYGLLYFVTYFCLGSGMTRLIPALQDLGYTPASSVVPLTILGLISFLIQFSCSIYFLSHSRFRWLSAVLLTGYWTVLSFSGFRSVVLLILSLSLVRPVQGVLDVGVHRAAGEVYSRIHCFGALGWAMGSLCSGWISHSQFPGLSSLYLAGTGILSLILLKRVTEPVQSPQSGSVDIHDLKLDPGIFKLILAATILYFTGSTDMVLMSNKMLQLQEGSRWLAVKLAIQSAAEIPLYLTLDTVMKKVSSRFLYRFSALMFALRFLLYSVSEDPLILCLVSSLQMVTLPLAVLSHRKRISELCCKERQASVLMLSMSIYTGISQLMMPVTLQWLQQFLSVDQTLAFLGLFSLSALFLIG